MKLSVVIPVLDGGPRFAACLTALVTGLVSGVLGDVVVVDGGSTDHSRALATDMGATVISAPRGRGGQIIAGVAAARNDWLLILHADTVLSHGWDTACQNHMDKAGQARAACFRLAFDDASPGARRVAGLANWRARTFGLPYGDQGLLIHRSLLEAVGGLRPLPLMEDLDLVRRLGARRIVMLDVTAETSAERYRRGGWWAVPGRNLVLAGLFLAGVKPATLKGLYR